MTIMLTQNLIVKEKKLFIRLNSTKVAFWLKKCTLLAQNRGSPFWAAPIGHLRCLF